MVISPPIFKTKNTSLFTTTKFFLLPLIWVLQSAIFSEHTFLNYATHWSSDNHIYPHKEIHFRKDKRKLTTAEHWGNNQSWGQSSRRNILSGTSVTVECKMICQRCSTGLFLVNRKKNNNNVILNTYMRYFTKFQYFWELALENIIIWQYKH